MLTKTITYVPSTHDYDALLNDQYIGSFAYHLDAENALNAHTLGLIMSGAIPDDEPLPNPLPDDKDPPQVVRS
jgi:hypothetical protein